MPPVGIPYRPERDWRTGLDGWLAPEASSPVAQCGSPSDAGHVGWPLLRLPASMATRVPGGEAPMEESQILCCGEATDRHAFPAPNADGQEGLGPAGGRCANHGERASVPSSGAPALGCGPVRMTLGRAPCEDALEAAGCGGTLPRRRPTTLASWTLERPALQCFTNEQNTAGVWSRHEFADLRTR